MSQKKSKNTNDGAKLQAASVKDGVQYRQEAGVPDAQDAPSEPTRQKKRKILRVHLQALFEATANTRIGDEDGCGDYEVRQGRKCYVPIIVFRDIADLSLPVIIGNPGDKFEWLDYEDDAIGGPLIEEVNPDDPSLNGTVYPSGSDY